MGSNFQNYAFASSDDPLGVFMLIILGLVAVYIGYKTFLYYMDRRKWSWFLQLCKEKKMNQKEASYLKNVVMRKKIVSSDELYGSIYSLNLPSPIKRKLLWDDEPVSQAPRRPTRVQR